MTFEFRTISNIGSRHPVVARLGVQASDLIKLIDLDEKKRNALQQLYLVKLMTRLLRCHEIRDELDQKTNDAIRDAESTTQVSVVPHLIGLQALAESFLYETKNYLRDLLELFTITSGCTLRKASALADPKGDGDSKLVKWAIADFGPDDRLTQLLKTEQAWIGYFIRMRNAVEHPGGYSGSLTLNNIRAIEQPNRSYVPPTWKLTDVMEASIVAEMDVGLQNMLTFAEELLAHAVMRKRATEHMIVYEIGANDRKPECPVRFAVGLSPVLADSLREAAEKKSS
jgi:hypothetical protein